MENNSSPETTDFCEVTSQDNTTNPIIPPETKSAIANNELISIPITNENVALNVMVSFLSVAQKRGAFSFDESAKIWECIQKFITSSPVPPSSSSSSE
jgi:hypothetical protein